MSAVDAYIAAWLVPLAVWLLVSGADDLFVDLVCLGHRIRLRFSRAGAFTVPAAAELTQVPEKRIAVLVPLWREHRVIGRMLDHNLASTRYRNYDLFVGCYPNDALTVDAVREVAARAGRVHISVCPHGGPTSKADCLNWTWQQMLLYEAQHGVRFEIVVTQDAEDLMHPESLRWINFYADRYDMVQLPVLPLPTGWRQFTHGVYCDEFAEFQIKDVPVRQLLGGFIPSNGVGTGYSRRSLEKLAAAHSNCIFDPRSLTEDYLNGLRLKRLGCTQLFVPIRFQDGMPVATREYFPRQVRLAIRQRARWVIGIALQTWEQYGWSGGWLERYWFWRDRKGLLGYPVTFLANAIFLYGLVTWVGSRLAGVPWGLGQADYAAWALAGALVLQLLRTGVRAGCVARIYGWRFAAGTPLRIFWGNWINFLATTSALRRYLAARLRAQPQVWLKTEHTYPPGAALIARRRLLGELLADAGCLTPAQLETALSSKPPGVRLGEYLVSSGKLTEKSVYQALSRQQNLPFQRLATEAIRRPVARALPAAVIRKWSVLPYKVASGHLFVAGPEVPTEAMQQELRKFTRLEIRFQFITPSNFEQLKQALIEPRGAGGSAQCHLNKP